MEIYVSLLEIEIVVPPSKTMGQAREGSESERRAEAHRPGRWRFLARSGGSGSVTLGAGQVKNVSAFM